MKLIVLKEALNRVQSLLKDIGVNCQRLWGVIHPGAMAPSRRYPPESCAEVARELVRDKEFQKTNAKTLLLSHVSQLSSCMDYTTGERHSVRASLSQSRR